MTISAAGRDVLTTTAKSMLQLLMAYQQAFGAERLATLQGELTALATSIAHFSPED